LASQRWQREGGRAGEQQQRDVDTEHGGGAPGDAHLAQPQRDSEQRGGRIVVTEIATPTAAAARVSKESIAATPAARATSTVE